MQILFLSDRNNWIVFVAGPGGDEVHIYDSLNSHGQGYSRESSKAICQKAYCSSATLRIINMPVQHQPSNLDCGVFAIAFSTDCVFNIKPETATCNANSPEGMIKTKQIWTICENYKTFK